MCLDDNDLNSYRTVSNQCLIGNMLDKLIHSHVSSFLSLHYICKHFSEHIVLVISLKDLFRKSLMICSFYLMQATCLCQLCLSFLQHLTQLITKILVHRIHPSAGLTDAAIQWFTSYLTDRIQYVSLFNHCSVFASVHSGVSQGSVLGSMLFSMCSKTPTYVQVNLQTFRDTSRHSP